MPDFDLIIRGGTVVTAADTFRALQSECDEVVCLLAPEDFLSVGSFYSEFPQTADDEIQLLLSLARQRRPAYDGEPPIDHQSS